MLRKVRERMKEHLRMAWLTSGYSTLDYIHTLSRLCNSYGSQGSEGREKAMPRHSDRRYRANTDHKEVA